MRKIINFFKKMPYSRYLIIFLMDIFVTSRVKNNYKKDVIKPYNTLKVIVYMADGKIRCGGLSDRFRGIVSAYKLCKQMNLEFKINFSQPFNLQDYLLPNTYDWLIDESNVCYNSNYAKPHFITSTSSVGDEKAQLFFANKYFRSNYKQIHLYTNMYFADKEYGVLFRELFKPTDDLQTLIDYNKKQIGGDYIAVVFRFQQLLGDFKEGDYPELPQHKKDSLIAECLELLRKVYIDNQYPKILVTSDSTTFLSNAGKLDFTYIIPGEIVHPDYSHTIDPKVYMKSFLDYYMLSEAQKVYLVVDEIMYHSGFAYRGALHNQVPYNEISLIK